jgi:hypothetical protein
MNLLQTMNLLGRLVKKIHYWGIHPHLRERQKSPDWCAASEPVQRQLVVPGQVGAVFTLSLLQNRVDEILNDSSN